MERTIPPKGKFKSEGFLIVDKRMIRLYGTDLAIFMSNLIDKYYYWKGHGRNFDGSFFLTHTQQIKQTGLTDHLIRKCKRQAISNGWIITRLKGSPAREWYELNFESPDTQAVIDYFEIKPSTTSRSSPRSNRDHIIKPDLIKSNNNFFYGEEKTSYYDKINISQFEEFWSLFPNKYKKGSANTAWNKLCESTDCPTWQKIKEAINAQMKTESWLQDDGKWIPSASKWLNELSWLNDPGQMTGYYDHT